MKAARVVAAATGVTAVLVTAPAYADSTGTTSSTPTGTTTCGALPAWVEGQPPGVHARAAAGDYLWHDANGWHLRVTHRAKNKMVFVGRITASSPVTYTRVRDEKRDRTVLSSDGKTLTFRFVNYGGIDGVDFTDACAVTTKFAFAIDGRKAPVNRIYVGAHSSRPTGNPFTISRQDGTAAA